METDEGSETRTEEAAPAENKGPANGGERNEREDRNGRDRDRGSSETRSKPPADSRRDGAGGPVVRRVESKAEHGFSSITNSDDPQLLESRLFIGNLPTDQVGKREVEEKFCKYGKILGCSVHKGFGFIQYERVEEARLAIQEEGGSMYHGLKIDVKMAKEGRQGNPPLKRPYNLTRSREEYRPPPGRDGRDYPPGERRERGERYYPERSRSPSGYDRREDPYRRGEQYPPGREREYPPRREEAYPDYRRPHPDEHHRREDYRRPEEDYGRRDPREARDPGPPPPPAKDPVKERPTDAYLVVIHKTQRDYAEMIENRIKEFGILTDMVFLTDEKNLLPAIEDIGRRGTMYAITVSPQHEVHRSLTLNILQGTPQEHRNMPMEDAIAFIGKSFDTYISILKEKAERLRKEEAMRTPLPHLLGYLADGRYLTVEELDRIQDHIRERKNRLLASKGLPPEPSHDELQNASKFRHKAIQSKILNMMAPGE